MPRLDSLFISAFAALTLVSACGGDDDGGTADAAPTIDAMEIAGLVDAGDPVACTGDECSCPTGFSCVYECPDGECTFECATGAECEISCEGGDCTTTCAAGSVCNVNCTTGCTMECEGDSCMQMCEGAHTGCECNGC